MVSATWDEAGIAYALGKVATDGSIRPEHGYVIEALRRSRGDLADANIDEIGSYLRSLDDSQIPGVVNNVKGIAHEVLFVEAENADGDAVQAYLFEDTNHPDYDVVLIDADTGVRTELQLKATGYSNYAGDAVNEVGPTNVRITEELAEAMDLPSSGVSNDELTADVEQVVDGLIDDTTLMDYVPALSAWSLVVVIVALTRRHWKGQITRRQYGEMLAKAGGRKVLKIIVLVAALSVPGLNVAVGAGLMYRTIQTIREVYGSS